MILFLLLLIVPYVDTKCDETNNFPKDIDLFVEVETQPLGDCTPPTTTTEVSTTFDSKPYCDVCLELVKPMCILTGDKDHKICEEFTNVSPRELCSDVGAEQICYAIKENKEAADKCVCKDNKRDESEKCDTPQKICEKLELCGKK